VAQQEKEITLDVFQTRLGSIQAFVVYAPLRTEVPNHQLITLPLDAVLYQIQPRPSLNPLEEAKEALDTIGDLPAVVFMPGRAFDTLGTREGQGGGWYDRFLAHVPSSWLRVGFCYEHQLSSTPLTRNEWDQPVDYVFVVSKTGEATIYETHARSGTL